MSFCITHDPHPSCRAEAIRASNALGLITEDLSFKDAIFTSLSIESSALVKREAEAALIGCGFLFASQADEQGSRNDGARIQTIQAPYPHILAGKSQAEIEIFLRPELVGEKELGAVIDQLKDLGKKESIMAKVHGVLRDDEGLIEAGLELHYDEMNQPQVGAIHSRKANPVDRKLHQVSKSINGPTQVRVEQALAVK